MSKASAYAAAYASWYAEKKPLNDPYSDWYRRIGKTLPNEAVSAAWHKTDAYREYQARWNEWISRQPEAPMYWVNDEDEENFIGVGDDGGLVFMPVRDAGGEGVDAEDIPKFLAWLTDTFTDGEDA